MPQLEEKARVTVVRRASGTPADGSAPSAVEYAIIAVLIAAVAVGTWKTFGEVPQPDATGARTAP
jgi:hypothetical protein